MALRRSLSQHLSHVTKISSPAINLSVTKTSFSSPSLKPTTISPDSTNGGFFRRFIQKRALVQSAMSTDKLMEKLRGMNTSKNHLLLEGLIPPTDNKLGGISVDDAKKLLRLAQLEKLKSKFRRIPITSISYSEFLQICKESSSDDQGLEFAKMLDESGAVIVIKDTVFLRPEQITKAIQGVISLPVLLQSNDPRMMKELEKMEKERTAIDKKAEALVRGELKCGLGFLVFQTAGFIRLTFWELSWDVMEPICFFLTSFYFMASYAFFLRTSQEPSFEGFFQSRLRAKQKRLMKAQNFDMERFDELRRACYPDSLGEHASEFPASPSFNNSEGSLICAMHH